MLPPETNVNGVNIFKDKETFIDSNKVFNIVNKLETTCNDKNERKIHNMSYEYTNISTALLCNHDSELDPSCSAHSMGVNNTINNCSKIHSPPVNSDLLIRGSVNTIDIFQNVYTQNELKKITTPCHMKANAMFQNCHNSDRFSKDRNCTVTWAHDARNQLTCHLGDFESPAGDPAVLIMN